MATAPTFKKILMFILVLAVGFGLGYLIFTHKSKTDPVENTPVVTTDDQNPASQEMPTVTSSKKTLAEKTSDYEIDIQYPLLASSDLSSSIVATMNTNIRAQIDDMVAQFKKDNGDGAATAPTADKSTLTMRYKVYAPAHNLQTIAYDVSDYSAGAAHPNTYVSTITFDITTGQEKILTELCEHPDTCLASFAVLAQKNLKPLLVKKGATFDDWAKEGSSASVDNYKVFIVIPESLDVIFNPYQVAAYALGHIRTPISWADISPLLLPLYRN